MRTLLVSLNEHSLAMLRGIAELRVVPLASSNRDEVAVQLAATLGDEASIVVALQSAPADAQAAWTALRRAGGKMKVAAFARQFGEIRPAGPGRLEREALWRNPENAAEALWYRGLIFRAFADFGEGPMEYFYIPEDLRLPPLQQPAAARPRSTPLPQSKPPVRVRHALNSLAVDTCTVLAWVRQESPFVSDVPARGSDVPPSIKEVLLLSDLVRLDLLWALASGLGWLAGDRGRWVLDNQRVGSWLQLTHWEQMSLLFSSWRDSTLWNDLKHTPELVSEGEWSNEPVQARRKLLRLLQRLDGRTWYRVSDVVAAMKKADPDFQRPDGNYSGWYLRDAGSGRYLSGFESWDAVEGRLLRFLIEGPLFWLGAVATSVSVGAGNGVVEEDSFRLTPAGAAWLSSRMPQKLPQPARVTVGDDFMVTAPLLTPLSDRFRLARFTDQVAAGQWEQRRDTLVPGPTRHRITRASLARGREAGVKPEDAVSFLRRAAGRLPAKVAAAIERYSQLGGQVRITRGAVLRVADASTLAAMRGDPVIAPLLGELVSAQAVIVPEANLERLLAVLKDSGYSAEIA